MQVARTLLLIFLSLPRLALSQIEQGIPVTEPLVISKCGTCHPADQHGIMEKISLERTTPEGWEEALKRMIRTRRVTLTPVEARAIIKYLSGNHGLAPEETKPIMYYSERRIHDEAGTADENLSDACTKCHAVARPLSWRRSLDDWKSFAEAHVARFKLEPNAQAIAFLGARAPLHTPEWAAWSTRTHSPEVTGRWLVTSHIQGRGQWTGEMDVQPGGADGEFLTRVTLKSVNDGSALVRTGRNVVYSGYQWRGRSKGDNPSASEPDSLSTEAREVMWIAPDGSSAEGRWFWGQYQEFGFDVKMRRPSSQSTLLAVDLPALKIGSQANHVRLIGDQFPTHVLPADISAGLGLTVRRIISATSNEIAAEIDVASDAVPGKRDLSLRGSTLPSAIAVYDRVDYVKVTPESSLAAFGNESFTRGYQQYEAIGYQRGPDGKPHTADDLELGPVDVTWSMEVFYETDASKRDVVGKISPTGLFIPAAESPTINYDIWVVATAKNEKNKDGKPLVGKGYVVVTVPSYTFQGRKYIRELDRWIEDGSPTR